MKLSELKFGQIVYDTLDSKDNLFFGEKGVYCGFKDGVHMITWEESGINTHCEHSELAISLEPPKRKVIHEFDRYVSDTFIKLALKGYGINGLGLFTIADNTFKNKVNITFETEE